MAKRSPSLPDVPTYQEAGIDRLVLDQWLGVFVPAGTPPAIVDAPQRRDEQGAQGACHPRPVRQVGAGAVGGTPGQFAKLVHDDFDKYARLTKELNIKVD